MSLDVKTKTGTDAAAQLRAAFDSGASVYALVDPMLGEPLPLSVSDPSHAASLQAAREQAWDRQVQAIELDRRIALAPALHPYLVTLGGHDDDWLASTLEMAQAERAAAQQDGLMGGGLSPHRIAWLQSGRFASELARILAPLMHANTAGWPVAHYLRLADRRVLDWLRQIIGDERIAAGMGSIRRWVYLDARGRIAQLYNQPDGPHAEQPQPPRLSHPEWKLLLQGQMLHPVLARWLGEAGPHAPGPEVTDADLYRRAVGALEHADQAAQRWPARFTSAHDRSAWAVLSLLHPGLENNHRVTAMLDAPGNADDPVETLQVLCGALHAALSEGTAS